jgi:hypothetical protein
MVMSTQLHKYWFICYIDPAKGSPVIYRTSHTYQYQVDAEAQSLLGTKGIPFVVVGVDTLGDEAMRHIKAQALKLTNDIAFARRASHSIPENPNDIMEAPQESVT